ncbi:Flp family type IVb pilin [Fodinicurvata sediminis]|uniref:Flp family type IVb pilin n=1 Tax=Fodinicurvata sediminis TaxID=1121832 RepID=UPI000403873B|nr:Flp family type IVb pilin [Fodinicurvata sediminis]
MGKILAFLRQEKGATAVEYALIIALVAAVLVGGATTFGDDLESVFTDIGNKLTGEEGDDE